jgi:hypothetical protein
VKIVADSPAFVAFTLKACTACGTNSLDLFPSAGCNPTCIIMEQPANGNEVPPPPASSGSLATPTSTQVDLDPHSDASSAKATAAKQTLRLRVTALSFALIGIVFGCALQKFVGGALDATGLFGTTLDTVVEQQTANFQELNAKLAALSKAAPGSPEAATLQKDISTLVATQEKLADRTHVEMKSLQDEVTTLRAQALKENRTVGGADFWLLPSESVTLRDRDSVFSLAAVHYNGSLIDVNLSGKITRHKPGDFLPFETSDSTCKVFYKVAHKREDGRFGFDLVSTPK